MIDYATESRQAFIAKTIKEARLPVACRAMELYGDRRNAAHYLRAVRYLRARRIWINDPGTPAKWGIRDITKEQ